MPIFPPPPGLLTTELVVSTRRFEVHIACIVRATTSTPAPGAKGTISSTCFEGFQPCACAGNTAAAAIKTIRNLRNRTDMVSLPLCFSANGLRGALQCLSEWTQIWSALDIQRESDDAVHCGNREMRRREIAKFGHHGFFGRRILGLTAAVVHALTQRAPVAQSQRDVARLAFLVGGGELRIG